MNEAKKDVRPAGYFEAKITNKSFTWTIQAYSGILWVLLATTIQVKIKSTKTTTCSKVQRLFFFIRLQWNHCWSSLFMCCYLQEPCVAMNLNICCNYCMHVVMLYMYCCCKFQVVRCKCCMGFSDQWGFNGHKKYCKDVFGRLKNVWHDFLSRPENRPGRMTARKSIHAQG
jgi:hypothetical protein